MIINSFCQALTSAFFGAYSCFAAGVPAVGFGSPNLGAAKAAKRHACGFFYASACPFMGGRGGGREAACAPTGLPTRYVPPTPFGSGKAVTQPTYRSIAMSKPKCASAQIVSPVLRCRKGDLAFVLAGPRAGYIVDVLEYHPRVVLSNGKVMVDAWHTRHPSYDPDVDFFNRDKNLLPIRPGDLEESETDAEENVSPIKGETA